MGWWAYSIVSEWICGCLAKKTTRVTGTNYGEGFGTCEDVQVDDYLLRWLWRT